MWRVDLSSLYVPDKSGKRNAEEITDIDDVLYLINYLYKGGPAPDCS